MPSPGGCCLQGARQAPCQPQLEQQEYFDRQDHYTLMFFFDANYNFYARIKVNDWVVHLSDVGL